MTASESRYALTSQRDYNILRDHTPPYNPSSPILARDETEPTSQRLLSYSSKGGAEPRKSSLLPIIEAYSI